jgi:large subunit ribosomal protein L25
MKKVALNVELRENKGKGVARSLRRGGNIPAVMYGLGAPTALTINRKELVKIINAGVGGNTLITVNLAGQQGNERMAVLRDYQTDPISNELMHADLLEVSMEKAIHVTIPVMMVGNTPEGVKEGGILQHMAREIEVECLPANIPEHIDVDASALVIGSSIHVGDLKLPDGVKARTEAETVIVTLVAPISDAKLDEMLAGEKGEVKEPEVLTKAKKEE